VLLAGLLFVLSGIAAPVYLAAHPPAYLCEARFDEVAAGLARAQPLTGCRPASATVNRDLFPRDEFASR
jgi:hypothetical protein